MSEDILDQFTFGDEGIRVLPLMTNTPKAPNGDPLVLLTKEECEGSSDPLCGKCDELLQQFHRYDENLSVQGKWAGGSVTGVCRGWGTPKVSRRFDVYDSLSS